MTMDFNSATPNILHMDLNSCFATIEQQANPHLRGKPVVVAAFPTPRGCVLAASVEAKRLGVKTGMRVMDGRAIYPELIVLPPDPWKYRNVHLKLRRLISDYTNDFSPKSIDEFVLNMNDYLSLKDYPLKVVAQEIKQRIKTEIGDWLTVSIGIAPNSYLAKIGAGIHKPDGLDEINKDNFLDIYSKLKLTDLTGIKARNATRLNCLGIYCVKDFYLSPVWKLKAAFHSITGLYWHTRLRGYEVDDAPQARRSYGNSTAIGANLTKVEELSPILARLTEKMCSRLRAARYSAHGIHLMIVYKDGSFWHKGHRLVQDRFDSRDFYKAAFRLLMDSQSQKRGSAPVLNIAVSCFDLTRTGSLQLDMFENVIQKESLVCAADKINKKWGDFTVGSARGMGSTKNVLDRIAFGGVKELEELVDRQL